MKCPRCGHPKTDVDTTDTYREGREVKRYRSCPKCYGRFTTLEIRAELVTRTPTNRVSAETSAR